jgi:hypothetical protein
LQLAFTGRDETLLSKRLAGRMLTGVAATGNRIGLGVFLVDKGGSIYLATERISRHTQTACSGVSSNYPFLT